MDLEKIDIFFVITGTAVIVFTIVFIIAGFYIVKILKHFSDISHSLRNGVDDADKGIRDVVKDVEGGIRDAVDDVRTSHLATAVLGKKRPKKHTTKE